MILGPAPPGKRRGGAKPSPHGTPQQLRRRARKRASARRIRKLRLRAGLCAECGNEKLDGRYLGKRCLSRRRPRAREFKRVLRDSGICCQCNQKPATGSGLCDGCYAKWKPLKYRWLGLPPPAEPGRRSA